MRIARIGIRKRKGEDLTGMGGGLPEPGDLGGDEGVSGGGGVGLDVGGGGVAGFDWAGGCWDVAGLV